MSEDYKAGVKAGIIIGFLASIGAWAVSILYIVGLI